MWLASCKASLTGELELGDGRLCAAYKEGLLRQYVEGGRIRVEADKLQNWNGLIINDKVPDSFRAR